MKKVGYVFLLIVVIAGIVGFFMVQNFFGNNKGTQIVGMRSTNEVKSSTTKTNEVSSTSKSKEKSEATIKSTLDDGILYSYTGNIEKADVVIGDSYFDTQINDLMLNYNEYKGKIIEIEGMYIDIYSPYTIVGRYTTNSLCPYCPAGFSALEFIWDGDKIDATNEESWIKVTGKFCIGNDKTSNYEDYYYIDASSIEVMNESGVKTVAN